MTAEDGRINADLLALADDDDSESDVQHTKPSSKSSRSPPSRRQSPSPPPRSRSSKPVAQKKDMPSRTSTSRRRPSDDDGDVSVLLEPSNNPDVSNADIYLSSAADSLGSGAMSESDSDASPPPPVNDGPLFPIDGRFKSEAERATVMALPEFQREEFLADRAEDVQKASQDAQLRQLMASRARQDAQKKRKADSDDDEKPEPKRTAKTKTRENIDNYKRAREERNERRERGDGRGRRDYRSRSRSRSDRGSQRDVSTNSEVEWDDQRRPSPVRREPPPTMRDFVRVKVGRSNFSKIYGYPGFEDTMLGCFCRVAIGPHKETGRPQYRMTQIKGFKESREYKMEAPNGRIFKTKQYVILAHGKAEKDWPLIACSDGAFEPSEYDRYLSAMNADGLRIPSASSLNDKRQDIADLLQRNWTDTEITQRLKKLGWDADSNQTAANISTSAQASSPTEGTPKSSPSKVPILANGAKAAGVPTQQERMAALNNRNRRANAESIRKAQIEERKRALQLQEAMRKGEATADPFARVKTISLNKHDANRDSRANTPAPGEKPAAEKAANGDAPKAAVVRLKPQKKRMMDDEVLVGLDLGIDIEI